MSNLIRSFNIANSVAFVIGEAKRQIMQSKTVVLGLA
jgi:tRNA (cytidine/uridine-2'-O-)-methyltransferase